MAITNKVGPPVTGDDFYGRVNELAQAHGFLDSNHSLVLSAPRRIGKSSFAKRLIEDKEKVGWKYVYIDLEGLQTQNDFLNTLINKFDTSKIWNKAAEAAGSLIKRAIESVKGIGPVKIDFSRPEESQNLFTSLSEGMKGFQNTMDTKRELSLYSTL